MRKFLTVMAGVGVGALCLALLALIVLAAEGPHPRADWNVPFAVAGSAIVFADEGPAARGERLTLSAKPSCKTCHSPKLNPLTDLEKRMSDEEIKDWIRRPATMFKKAGKHGKMPPYRFSDEELEAVVAYLKTL